MESLKKMSLHGQWIKFLAVLIPTVVIAFLPTNASFTPEIRLFFVITICAILIWAVDFMNMFIVALALPVVFVLSGLADATQVFAPWTQHLPYLVLGALIISALFEQSGFMERLAYWFITKIGGSYLGILLALTTSGFLISFFVPGSLARVALYGGMVWGICKAMGFERFSKAAAGLMLGAYNAAVTTSFIVLTGVEPVLLMNTQLASLGMEGISYISYIRDNALISILWAYTVALLIAFLFRPEQKVEGRAYFKEKYQALGKMRMQEKKIAVFLIVLVMLLATSSYHKIELGWIFILMATVAFIPGINLGNQDTMKQVNYGMIFFITATMAIGQVSNSTGAGSFMAQALMPFMTLGGSAYTVFAAWVLGVGVNFVLTPFAAAAALTIPLAEMANQLQMNVLPMLYAFNHGLYEVLLPYESTLPLLIYSFGVLSFRHFLKFFGAQMIANAFFICLIAIPYWILLGLL